MHQSATTILVSLLSIASSAIAQTNTDTAPAAGASPDGVIVPFGSGLPACASLCGPLFDVQGKCSPPASAAVDNNCFCTDTRLTALSNDNGVSPVCGPASCTAASDLTAVSNWYKGLCGSSSVVSTAANGPTVSASSTSAPVASSSGSGNRSWISGHYQWVIMICVIFVAIVGGWIGACLLRRRYLRKKEREIEMRPPVAWGPHQMQGVTGGYGDVVVESHGSASSSGGHGKEFAAANAAPATTAKSLQKKSRFLLR
ncbi:integral membrane protein [Diplocarpon rosae]|nr:integral membrane protein [Diplocarpon rosae]